MLKFKQIFAAATLRHSISTVCSTVINGALGILFYLLAARWLGVEQFGQVALAITVLTLVADIGNLGTDTGIIRFVGKYAATDLTKAKQFLKLGLETKLLMAVLMSLIGGLLAPEIAQRVFNKPSLSLPLTIALVGSGSAMVFSFATNALQGLQKYIIWGGLNIASNTFRLLLILGFFSIGLLNAQNTLLIYILVPLLGFLVGLMFLPRFTTATGEWKLKSEFFHYNKWIALLSLLAAISSRVDTFLVARFLSVSDLGLYGLASQLTMVFPQVVYAIAAVVAPKLASFTTTQQAASYLKKLQLFIVSLVLVSLAILPILLIVIPLILGRFYLPALVPFSYLYLANALFLLALPVHQAIFYYFAKPQVFILINSGNLVLVLLLGSWLIPVSGVVGAGQTMLLAALYNLLIPAGWVLWQFKHKQ